MACIICNTPVGGLSFCSKHWTMYKDDYKAKKPWVRYLLNEEQKEYRHAKRDIKNGVTIISIDSLEGFAYASQKAPKNKII